MVILVAFAFMFYLSYKSKVEPAQRNVGSVGQANIEKEKVRGFVTDCLSRSTKKGLLLIGKQGGFIFPDQNYSLIDFGVKNVTLSDGSRVAYLINEYNPNVMSGHYYPCYKPGSGKPQSKIGDTCHVTYNHLQKYGLGSYGATKLKLKPDLCSYTVDDDNYECSYGGLPFSIQHQLVNYIEQSTLECINFSEFKNLEISLKPENASANLTFSERAVNVMFKLPISLKSKQGVPITEVLYFRQEVPARIKPMYDLLYSAKISSNNYEGAIFQDTTNASFNLVKDLQKMAFEKYPDLQISKRTVLLTVDLITINDTNPAHSINGEFMIFRFARENRPPALDYIGNHPSQPYDIYVVAGEKVLLAPQGYDPDEDKISYNYAYGWKSTWNDVYHSPSCDSSPNIYNETVPISTNLWHVSDEYIDGCLHPFYGFISKNCASIQTTCSDVGMHNLTLMITDDEGLVDSQVIKIFVDSKPQGFLEGYNQNFYPDIPEKTGSIEDPFVLNASKTEDALHDDTLIYHFTIWDPAGLSSLFETEWNDKDVLSLQNVPITGIVPYWFNQIGIHLVTVDIKKEESETEATTTISDQFTIHSCIPHRSNAAPYPFNDLSDKIDDNLQFEENEYLGNHSCCLGEPANPATWGLADSGFSCYKLEDYGCRADFVSQSSETTIPLAITGIINPVDGGSGYREDDVYIRRVERKCSGLRGNICDGDFAQKSITFLTECPEPGMDIGCSKCEYGIMGCVKQPVGTICNQTSTGKITCGGCDVDGKCSLDVACN